MSDENKTVTVLCEFNKDDLDYVIDKYACKDYKHAVEWFFELQLKDSRSRDIHSDEN